MPKYVVSSTIVDPGWANTTVLRGDLVDEVVRLKDTIAGDIVVPASVRFVRTLLDHGLIDEMREGVIERMRVTPTSRLSMLLGRAGRDVTITLVQGALLVAIAIPFGLSVSLEGLVVVFGLLVALYLGTLKPQEQHVRVVLGAAAPEVIGVELQYIAEDGEIARQTRFTYPAGAAPRIVAHEPELPNGEYEWALVEQRTLPGGEIDTIVLSNDGENGFEEIHIVEEARAHSISGRDEEMLIERTLE